MLRFLSRTLFVVLLVAFGTVLLVPPHANGQETEEQVEDAGPRWGVGGQLMPLVGLSVRRALTDRLTVQVGGMPLPGKESRDVDWKGVVGARGLYKGFAGSWYNVFAGAVVGGLRVEVDERTVGDGILEEEFEVVQEQETINAWYGGVSVGAEAIVASRVGVSLEIVALESGASEAEVRTDSVTPGIGLHYYW